MTRNNLDFRGTWTELFGTVIVVTLLTLITCGIYAPWGYAQMRRVVLAHTFYRDRPLRFDGTGGQVFGELLWILLFTVITLGLYPLLGFAQVRLLKWECEHTILPDGRRLEYRGSAFNLFGQYLLIGLLSTLTLGIYYFWGYTQFRRHIIAHTFIQGYGNPFQFTGTGGQYLGVALVNLLLTIITLGIYSLLGFAMVRTLKWDTGNTVVPFDDRSSSSSTESNNVGAPSGVNITVNVTR
ncbi:MAG: DUF898 family protein [Caldilineaceae bacterium]